MTTDDERLRRGAKPGSSEMTYIDSEAGPAECLRCGLRVNRVTPGYVEDRETPVEGREECPRCGDRGKPRIYRWDEEVA